MMKKMKSKKGFTLVEIVVVLVILAILAAIAIPAYTGYITKANDRAVIAEARTVLMAAQTACSEAYASNTPVDDTKLATNIKDLSEIRATSSFLVLYANDTYKVTKLVYSNGTREVTYNLVPVTGSTENWGAVGSVTAGTKLANTAGPVAPVAPVSP